MGLFGQKDHDKAFVIMMHIVALARLSNISPGQLYREITRTSENEKFIYDMLLSLEENK